MQYIKFPNWIQTPFILSNKIKIVLHFPITIKFKTTKKFGGGGGRCHVGIHQWKTCLGLFSILNFIFNTQKMWIWKQIKYNFFTGYLSLLYGSTITLALIVWYTCGKVWVKICNTSIISVIVICNTNTWGANFTCWTLEWWMKTGNILKVKPISEVSQLSPPHKL